MSSIKHFYKNGHITVAWQPDLCQHSGNCFKGLPRVFNPKRKPWIEMEQADTETIMNQVKRCPSGALSFFINEDKKENL